MTQPSATTASPAARILIVDDHPLVRRGLAELIAHESDMTVCGDADDVENALQLIATRRPDLAVVDLSLKNSNGLDLIRQIKTRFPDVKVLVSSMHDESLYAERVLHAGAMGYINKQLATDKVIEAIRQVHRGQIYLSAEMTSQILHRLQGHPSETLEHPAVQLLSDRELQVFELIGHALSTRQIANRLQLSVKTIETHREHIKGKLNITNSAELTRHAVQWVLENS